MKSLFFKTINKVNKLSKRKFTTTIKKNKKTILIGTGSLFAVAVASISFQAVNPSHKTTTTSPLSTQQFREFELCHRSKKTHDTDLFRFKLPMDEALNMPIASCIVVKADIEGEEKPVVRPYTPTSKNDDKGFFDLIVKCYPTGKMSKHIHTLKPGDSISVKGPFPKIDYKPNMKKHIGMIAGGTGITPMFQVIQEVLRNPNDHTQITLLFANRSEDDIILKEELDHLASTHSNFKVIYVVDKAKDALSWKGEQGYIGADLITKYFPKPSEHSMVFVCGPPPMMKSISGTKTKDRKQGPLQGVLKQLHYDPSHVYKF